MKIYDQHATAFANVSAYIIMKDGERVATIAIKFPKDGAGRLHAYVHWIGVPMVRGMAGGYGYDKRSAAVREAFRNIDPGARTECEAFKTTMLDGPDGMEWPMILSRGGYAVLQAV